MRSFTFLLALLAFLAATIVAQDPEGDAGSDAEDAAYWGQLPDIEETPAVKGRFAMPDDKNRGGNRGFKDPYEGRRCPRQVKTPKHLRCDRNKCFLAFLDARRGSNERHCPSEAFEFCCFWLGAGDRSKRYAVRSNTVFKKAPYTRPCKERQDKVWDVVRKIDDVCGCTVEHRVRDGVNTDYYRLRNKNPFDRVCRKNH